MFDLFKQAQQMREKMERLQQDLERITVEGSAGDGQVKVVANGKNQILSLTIAPELLNDKARTEALVLEGVNQALRISQEVAAKEFGRLTGGLGPLASLFKGAP